MSQSLFNVSFTNLKRFDWRISFYLLVSIYQLFPGFIIWFVLVHQSYSKYFVYILWKSLYILYVLVRARAYDHVCLQLSVTYCVVLVCLFIYNIINFHPSLKFSDLQMIKILFSVNVYQSIVGSVGAVAMFVMCIAFFFVFDQFYFTINNNNKNFCILFVRSLCGMCV